ncbi:MAG: hypothetical protein JKY08_06065 [Flavobacteriaceae bacterium]|nr:hypothetical protein [Flavobacteriaceae bacterium]
MISRDTVRVSDINTVSKAIELHRIQEGNYPAVTNPINITFSGGIIWKQGSFGIDTQREARRITNVPTDPLTGSEYAYSVTQSTGEYQIGTIVENDLSLNNQNTNSELYTFTQQTEAANLLSSFATTKIKGNYNGKFISYIENTGDSKYIYIL